jgi:hypothetical protein
MRAPGASSEEVAQQGRHRYAGNLTRGRSAVLAFARLGTVGLLTKQSEGLGGT